MEDANLEHVVSLVKTYKSDWKSKKSLEKKRGITRITGMSKQKYQQNQPIPAGLNNQNFNNSNYRYTSQRKQKIVFHQQVEKPQILREQSQKRIKNKEPTHLVQSHYINCQLDVEQWIKVKQSLEERINNLQVQNNFLKINVGIQQQYIIKIQTQVDNLRLKCQHSTSQAQIQTSQLDDKVSFYNSMDCQIQCDLQQKEFSNFQKFSKEVEEQTNEFFNLIKKLQNEKQLLVIQNNKLVQKLQTIEQRLEQQSNSRQAIQSNLSKQIQNLIETECNLKMRLQSFEQSKQKILNQVNEQNKLYEREKQLRIQIEKQKQAALKIQMEKIACLQAKYNQKKQELDYLLSFLQQKKDLLTERDRNISTNLQNHTGFYSDRLADKEHQHSYRKDLANEYEDRVSKIKKSMDNYLEQLAQFRIQNESKYKQSGTKFQQVINKKNESKWEQKQKQIGQDIGYLINKVTSLQQLIDDFQKQKADKQRQILNKQNLLQVQFNKIKQLEQQNEVIRIQLQENANELRYCQHLMNTLQEQKMQLKSLQYQLCQQNNNLKSQLMIINQQLQIIKEKCNEDRTSVYTLKQQNQQQRDQIKQLTILLQNNSERLKRQLILSQQQINRYNYQREEFNRQLDTLQLQSMKQDNTIQSLRKELFQMSHKYEDMAKNYALAKRENVKLVQQGIQLKQKYEVIQQQIELITKSHRESIKEMEVHISKLQSNLQYQKQIGIAEKNEWQKKKQLVKKDYDILYNKYLKYKNIALKMQPNQD